MFWSSVTFSIFKSIVLILYVSTRHLTLRTKCQTERGVGGREGEEERGEGGMVEKRRGDGKGRR